MSPAVRQCLKLPVCSSSSEGPEWFYYVIEEMGGGGVGGYTVSSPGLIGLAKWLTNTPSPNSHPQDRIIHGGIQTKCSG